MRSRDKGWPMPPAAPSTATFDNCRRCQFSDHNDFASYKELYTFDAVEEKALRLTVPRTKLAERAANMMAE